MANSKSLYKKGLLDGLPIGLGYFPISFGFGISTVNLGLKALYAILISVTNLTSAGQVAGVSVIVAAGTLIEMALTQLVINLRYSLMGIALSQKLSATFGNLNRFILSFFITDEIFAVAAIKKVALTPIYMYGLVTMPMIGWSLGTACGAVLGSMLPGDITAALGIAIYGMFIAIVVPPSKKDRGVFIAVIFAAAINCIIKYVPLFKAVTPGFAIIICAVAASAFAALVMPYKETENE